MEVIWHGTAAVEYVCEGGRILFDPFVPLSGSAYQKNIPDYDGYSDIFVTHGHFDHIVNIPEIVKRNPEVRIHCTPAPYGTLLRKGVPNENLCFLRFEDSLSVNGFDIQVLHGKHAILPKATTAQLKRIFTSGNTRNIPFIMRENRICKENDETMVYIIQANGKKVFHMGSMNLRDELDYPKQCDLLLLPYNGWEDNFPPAKATIECLQPKRVLLHHFDNTFPPITSEPNLTPLLAAYGGLIVVPEYDREVEV